MDESLSKSLSPQGSGLEVGMSTRSLLSTRKGPKGLQIQVPPCFMVKCSLMVFRSVSSPAGNFLKMYTCILLGIYIQTRVPNSCCPCQQWPELCMQSGQPIFRPGFTGACRGSTPCEFFTVSAFGMTQSSGFSENWQLSFVLGSGDFLYYL